MSYQRDDGDGEDDDDDGDGEDGDDGDGGNGDDDFPLVRNMWTDSVAMRHERHTALHQRCLFLSR